MKVGILTFHGQLNYGGVLQCWALQNVLERMGHVAIVIDRRLYQGSALFDGILPRFSLASWGKMVLRSLLFGGGFAWARRCLATRRFIRGKLNLSTYHFYNWEDSPRDLGVDVVVVGSDQVWHCGDWGDPRPYLLEGAPSVKGVAYAASFGMASVPAEWAGLYKRGLPRFMAISCREYEGVDICHKLGFSAAHVVDPTLLAFYGHNCAEGGASRRKKLVCYLIGETFAGMRHQLYAFAKNNHCDVEVFVESPFVTSVCWTFSRSVRLMLAAGPDEFLLSLKSAEWVVTDSFHALMFSIINRRNARIMEPKCQKRIKMFARLYEYAEHTHGQLISKSLGAALTSFERGEEVSYDEDWLGKQVACSWDWLSNALAGSCK